MTILKLQCSFFQMLWEKFLKLIYFVLLCIMQKTDEANNYCSFVYMKTFDDVRQLKNQNQHGNDIQIFWSKCVQSKYIYNYLYIYIYISIYDIENFLQRKCLFSKFMPQSVSFLSTFCYIYINKYMYIQLTHLF